MSVNLVEVLPQGAVDETVVDRRTDLSWTVRVEPFRLSATVVTCGLWDEVHRTPNDLAEADLPKTDVSWRDAVLFCNALSVREGLTPVYEVSQRVVPEPSQWRAHSEPEIDDWVVVWRRAADGYRLPTDAEWQVACRAGSSGARYGDLDDIAWYAGNSGGSIHRVRMKEPNAWGLFDMLGGVWEWCWDLYDPAVYGSYRIIRGGGWSDPEWSCRAGVRRKTNPTAKFDDLGFRLARGAIPPSTTRSRPLTECASVGGRTGHLSLSHALHPDGGCRVSAAKTQSKPDARPGPHGGRLQRSPPGAAVLRGRSRRYHTDSQCSRDEADKMTVNAIVSMAMLKVNADSVGMSVLENFQPFVLDRLYHSGTEAVSAPDLRSAISTEYGVDIPTAVIQTLTKRIARDGLLTRDYGILKFNREDFAKYDLATSRQAAQQNYEMLMRAGSRFAEAEFSISLAPEQFAAAFLEFLRDETVPLLKTVIEGRAIIAQPEVEVGSLRYVVASFILDAFSNDPALAAALSTVVKGGVIASALYFPDPSGMNRRLDDLRVFLDTTLLLRLAGACGPDFERAASDLATLAVSRGASLRCFDHTLKECLGVLDASATSVKRGGGRYFGEATEHMVSAGWSYSDVIEFRDNFEERLGALGVSIHEKPAHVARLTVDEERLDSILQKEVHYSSTEAKYKDIDSITAVYRLRGGRAAPSLSKARAVFVTTNTALVRGSRKFAKIEELERGLIPLCIPDFFLTTALWVSQELVAPNLPSRQLIADCVSAVRVSDHLWKLYVEKIDKLVVAGNVGPEDYVMLRQSLEVRALIMFDTSEEPENFTEATVDKVLERRRLNLAAEAEAEAQRTLEEGRQREERLREVAERDRSDRERATNALVGISVSSSGVQVQAVGR